MNLNLPPLHPALVHFPIALVTLSFVFDLLGRVIHRRSFYSAGWWCLCAAAVTGVLAVPLGYSDMNRAMLTDETRELVDIHLKIGWILVVCVALLTFSRWMVRRQPDRGPGAGYLSAAFLVLALTLFQGWYGGEMVYGHGAGVAAAEQGTQSAEQARRPLEKVNSAINRIPGFASAGHEYRIHEAAGKGRGAETNQPENNLSH